MSSTEGTKRDNVMEAFDVLTSVVDALSTVVDVISAVVELFD